MSQLEFTALVNDLDLEWTYILHYHGSGIITFRVENLVFENTIQQYEVYPYQKNPHKYWTFEVLYENELIGSTRFFRVRAEDGLKIKKWMEGSFEQQTSPSSTKSIETQWLEYQLREFKHKLCSLARLDPVFTKIKLSGHSVRETSSKFDPSQIESRYVCKVEMGKDLFTVEISTGPNQTKPRLETFLPAI